MKTSSVCGMCLSAEKEGNEGLEMLNDEGMTGVRQILNVRIVCFNF